MYQGGPPLQGPDPPPPRLPVTPWFFRQPPFTIASSPFRPPERDMQDVLTLILGGGRGAALYPLTRHRSEPAVPFAGKYRLIDIPISNCLNSGLNRLYV